MVTFVRKKADFQEGGGGLYTLCQAHVWCSGHSGAFMVLATGFFCRRSRLFHARGVSQFRHVATAIGITVTTAMCAQRCVMRVQRNTQYIRRFEHVVVEYTESVFVGLGVLVYLFLFEETCQDADISSPSFNQVSPNYTFCAQNPHVYSSRVMFAPSNTIYGYTNTVDAKSTYTRAEHKHSLVNRKLGPMHQPDTLPPTYPQNKGA